MRAPRVALYRRVSTADQDPGLQSVALRACADRQGWAVVADLEEVGSGADRKRPMYRTLHGMVEGRQVDVVCVWRVDRLGRSLAELVAFLDLCHRRDVRLVSVNDGFDMGSPAGRAMFGMVAIFAEWERAVLAERTRAGVQRARERGVTIGRPRAAVDGAEVAQLAATGLSVSAIARRLGIARSTVYARLQEDESS